MNQQLTINRISRPAKLKHGKIKAYDYNEQTDRSPSIDRWKGFVRRRYGTTSLLSYKRAYADVIVREFANRYGTKIDGWWFDHASYGHMRLIHDICTEANPKIALAFNRGKLPSAANDNPDYEDFTSVSILIDTSYALSRDIYRLCLKAYESSHCL